MSVYEFAMLFKAYYKKTPKIDDGDDDENDDLEDEQKNISRKMSC
jgi:hypothetical protein